MQVLDQYGRNAEDQGESKSGRIGVARQTKKVEEVPCMGTSSDIEREISFRMNIRLGTDSFGVRDIDVTCSIRCNRCVVDPGRGGVLDHAVGASIGDRLGDPVSTDADDEGEVDRFHRSDGTVGVGGEEGTTTEEESCVEESLRGAIPIAGRIIGVVHVAAEDLVATLPHRGGADGEAGHQ